MLQESGLLAGNFLVFYNILYLHICVGCPISWTEESNTSIETGQINSANAIQGCQAACVNNGSCDGVDWNPSSPVGQRCWFSGPWSGEKNSGIAVGFTHYNLIIYCRGNNHRVREKKRPEYFSHNFDKFRHSFVIFGTNHPDSSVY